MVFTGHLHCPKVGAHTEAVTLIWDCLQQRQDSGTLWSLSTFTRTESCRHISKVSDQNGISLLYIMREIHHSGWNPWYYGIWSPHTTKFTCIWDLLHQRQDCGIIASNNIFLHLHLSRGLADRSGTTGNFATNFLHSSQFSAFRKEWRKLVVKSFYLCPNRAV